MAEHGEQKKAMGQRRARRTVMSEAKMREGHEGAGRKAGTRAEAMAMMRAGMAWMQQHA